MNRSLMFTAAAVAGIAFGGPAMASPELEYIQVVEVSNSTGAASTQVTTANGNWFFNNHPGASPSAPIAILTSPDTIGLIVGGPSTPLAAGDSYEIALVFNTGAGTQPVGVINAFLSGGTTLAPDTANSFAQTTIPSYTIPAGTSLTYFDAADSENVTLTAFSFSTPGNAVGSFTLTTSAVPEPASFVLLGAGLVGLCFARRRATAKTA